MADAREFPIWPPGFWRRILLWPSVGWIGAALEDDAHSFRLRIDHDDGRITRVHGRALRHPWSACPGALAKLQAELPGTTLADIARRDPREDCTHLHDLAILCAAHANGRSPIRFDMTVADRIEEQTTTSLAENGGEKLTWHLDGLDITGPGADAGRSLRHLSQWKRELSPRDAERALLLRRAVMVSGARRYVPSGSDRASEQGPSRLGACYNYQMPTARHSIRMTDWLRDFSIPGRAPLDGFDPYADFATLGEDA